MKYDPKSSLVFSMLSKLMEKKVPVRIFIDDTKNQTDFRYRKNIKHEGDVNKVDYWTTENIFNVQYMTRDEAGYVRVYDYRFRALTPKFIDEAFTIKKIDGVYTLIKKEKQEEEQMEIRENIDGGQFFFKQLVKLEKADVLWFLDSVNGEEKERKVVHLALAPGFDSSETNKYVQIMLAPMADADPFPRLIKLSLLDEFYGVKKQKSFGETRFVLSKKNESQLQLEESTNILYSHENSTPPALGTGDALCENDFDTEHGRQFYVSMMQKLLRAHLRGSAPPLFLIDEDFGTESQILDCKLIGDSLIIHIFDSTYAKRKIIYSDYELSTLKLERRADRWELVSPKFTRQNEQISETCEITPTGSMIQNLLDRGMTVNIEVEDQMIECKRGHVPLFDEKSVWTPSFAAGSISSVKIDEDILEVTVRDEDEERLYFFDADAFSNAVSVKKVDDSTWKVVNSEAV